MLHISEKLQNIITTQDTAAFSKIVGEFEAKIGFWGGRTFRVASLDGEVTANEILGVAKELFFEIEHDHEKRKVFETALHTFKELDAKADPESNWFAQILTFFRRFFGNFGYNRAQDVAALQQACLEPLKGHSLIGNKSTTELHKEFDKIPQTHPLFSFPLFMSAIWNNHLNRFWHFVPYDANRFHEPDAVPYINASWLLNKTAIATQAPRESEVEQANMWKMAFCSGSTQIAMVTNVQEGVVEKSSKYWPDVNQTRTFHDVSVTGVQEEIIFRETSAADSPYIVRREVDVHYKSGIRRITHYHLVNWIDMEVVSPEVMRRLVTSLRAPSQKDPLIVHCSAGIGRTGTLLAAQHLYFKNISQGTRLLRGDLAHTVASMRSHPEGRAYMVLTKEQYELIWRSLEALAAA